MIRRTGIRKALVVLLALGMAAPFSAGIAKAHGPHGHHGGGGFHHHGGGGFHHGGGYRHHGGMHPRYGGGYYRHHGWRGGWYDDDGLGTGLAIGGLVGLGVGAAVANSEDDAYNVCPDPGAHLSDRFPGQCY